VFDGYDNIIDFLQFGNRLIGDLVRKNAANNGCSSTASPGVIRFEVVVGKCLPRVERVETCSQRLNPTLGAPRWHRQRKKHFRIKSLQIKDENSVGKKEDSKSYDKKTCSREKVRDY
jgi:hypothetical protein